MFLRYRESVAILSPTSALTLPLHQVCKAVFHDVIWHCTIRTPNPETLAKCRTSPGHTPGFCKNSGLKGREITDPDKLGSTVNRPCDAGEINGLQNPGNAVPSPTD
ncbi:hypothetical protein MCEMSEM22_01898 [Comamonadaceae bacterium]